MQFVICEKHNKVQKAAHKVTTNSHVCMNRYCHDSFKILCSICKNEHRDHSNKILTVEDITFLVERLLKSPFKQLTGYIDQAVQAMKKLKLVQENKRKIQLLEKQVHKEVICLVQLTESLIHQYAVCKKNITNLSDMLVNIQTPEVFSQFKLNSVSFLSNLQYNFQKDKFEYGNQVIREKYERRKKSYQKTKRSLQEVRDYSMKIIEVILANDDSQEQEEDITYKKKLYQILKSQLQLGTQSTRNKQKQQLDLITSSSNKSKLSMLTQNCKSKLSTIPSTSKLAINTSLSIQKSCQTSSQWLISMQSSKKQSQLQIQKLKIIHARQQNQLKNKISNLVKEKQYIKKEMKLMEQKYLLKTEKIQEIQEKLRNNHKKRIEKEKSREQTLEKLIEIANWKVLVEGEAVE